MAKCLDCGTVYCVYGGSKGSTCPECKSTNIDCSKEVNVSSIEKIVGGNK
jgi:predicted Zn-ribbon and HTH transcriptional regulator